MKWVLGLRSVLFMTCRDAAPLISHAIDRELPPLDRTAVRLHLSICPSCRRYRGQLTLIRRVLLHLRDRPPVKPWTRVEALSPEASARIRRALERHGGDESSGWTWSRDPQVPNRS